MTAAPQSARRRILAWCLFDFANSPYTTLVVTFVYSTYFIKTFAPNEVIGTAWWSRAVAVAALVVALVSPVMGALADRGGLRVRFLALSTTLSVAATATARDHHAVPSTSLGAKVLMKYVDYTKVTTSVV